MPLTSAGPRGSDLVVLTRITRRLSSGLPVVVVPRSGLHSASAVFLARSGPRYEHPHNNGISHLVEHLLLRGSLRHPDSLSFHRVIEDLGGAIAGLTQRDVSGLQLTAPPDQILRALQHLGEVIVTPCLQGIDIERHVVIEELMETVDHDGHELDLDTLSRQALWAPHPMGLPIAGRVEIVRRLSRAECMAHHIRSYSAANSVLCVVGDVDPDRVFASAATAFAGIRPGVPLPESSPPPPPRDAPIQWQSTSDSQAELLLSFSAPAETHSDFPATQLIKRILDDGFSSRLRQALSEQTGLVYQLEASIDAYRDVAAFDVQLACDPAKLPEAVERTLATLKSVHTSPPDDAELQRAKLRHRVELSFTLDHPEELATWTAGGYLMASPCDHTARLKKVLDLSVDDVAAAAQSLFAVKRCVATLTGPEDEIDLRALEAALSRRPGSTRAIDGTERGPFLALAT